MAHRRAAALPADNVCFYPQSFCAARTQCELSLLFAGFAHFVRSLLRFIREAIFDSRNFILYNAAMPQRDVEPTPCALGSFIFCTGARTCRVTGSARGCPLRSSSSFRPPAEWCMPFWWLAIFLAAADAARCDVAVGCSDAKDVELATPAHTRSLLSVNHITTSKRLVPGGATEGQSKSEIPSPICEALHCSSAETEPPDPNYTACKLPTLPTALKAGPHMRERERKQASNSAASERPV